MADQTYKFPRLDENDRIPDRFMPQGVRDVAAALDEAKTIDDAIMTQVAGDPESAFAGQLNATIAQGRAVHDLSEFLAEGQALPNDGTANAAPLFNAAFSALRSFQAFDPRVQELYVPGGKYRLNSSIDIMGDAAYAERLTMRGESRESTTLLPYGNASAFHTPKAAITEDTPQDFWWFRDVHFADFLIDATNQNVTEWPTLLKAFQGGGWLNCTWTRVNAIGTTSTMFGTDYPVNCTFTDCWAIDAGRGFEQQVTPVSAAEMRSGFGIGFGHYDNESMTVIGGGATGCSRSGFFFERQDARGSLKRKSKITLIGVTATGNGNGVSDAGCAGVTAVNCDFSDNAAAGYYVGPNTQAKASGRDAHLTACTIMGNGVAAVYGTGTIYDDTNASVATFGGYVIESCRIEENAAGIIGTLFETVEAGGLTIRGNRFVRNAGRAIELTGSNKPVRDLTISGNEFDGNAGDADGLAVALLIPMVAPRATDNDFFNSDGVQRQKDAVLFHPAEVVTVPRVQRNTWRGHNRGLVGAERLDQTLVTDNLDVTSGEDPATSAAYVEYLSSKPNAEATTLGTGWITSSAGGALNWTRAAGGARVSSGSWGAVAVQSRDLETSGLYVESYIHASTQGAGGNRLRGVSLGGDGTTAVIAGADDVSSTLGAPQHYAMWLLSAGTATLLWESDVPAVEGHRVALAREEDSTVTSMSIDGVVVHTQEVSEVAVSTYAGVAGAAGVAGTSGSTASSRTIRNVRIVPVGGSLPEPPTIIIRNKALNGSFEVAGGMSTQWGTGGAGTDTRPSDPSNAHSGDYSRLLTWSTASTEPAGGGGQITAIEDVEAGKVYTLSVWVRSSRARKYRPLLTYFPLTNSGGTFTGSKNGSYFDVPADTWTRLSITTDALPATTLSVRLAVSAAALVNGGTNFQVGDTLRLDDYMCTEGIVLYDYFDGAHNGGTWVGTANASASTKVVPA